MKKSLSLVLVLVILVSTMSCISTVVSAGNYDTMATARNAAMGTTYSGSITSSDPADFYKITLSNSSTLNITFSGNANYVYIYLFDANGVQLGKYNPSKGASGVIYYSNDFTLVSGTYFVKFGRDSGDCSSYTCSFTSTSAGETFAESLNVNNNTMQTANTVNPNQVYTGQIAINDHCDFYKITLSSASKFTLQFNGVQSYIFIYLFDVNGNQVFRKNPSRGNSGEISYSEAYHLMKGTYYLKIQYDSGYGYGKYNFKYTTVNSGESFPETISVQNNTMPTANTIGFGRTYIGQIAYNDNCDFYKFTVTSKGQVKLSFTGYLISWIYIYLFDANGNELDRNNPRKGDNNNIVFNEVYDLDVGTYYIKISEDSGHGNYSINLSKYIETPKVTTANQTSGIKVSWNIVEGATKYEVYRRNAGSSSWNAIGTTTNAYIIDKNVANGKYYVYSVRAYDSSGSYSVYESGKTYTAKFVATPKMTGISNATNGVYVKWNSVPGAVEYRVYRRGVGSNSWTYLGTTKNLNYTDTGVKYKSGNYYRYTVRAVSGYFSGFDSNGMVIKRLENPSLKSTTSSKSGVTVKWYSVQGTTGYYVYRRTAGTNWTCIGAVGGTNNTTYLDRSARKGVTYYYTVRACYGSTLSAYNSGISCYDKY